jgi:D-arabinose 1-dehydrogenase-like Zn-dependent alcohol dehydrogenase
LREGGRLVLVGLGDGILTVDPMDLVQREASVIGAVQGPRADLRAVLELAAQGRVLPRVETFPLHLVNRAMSRLGEGRVRYRAVISFDR